MSNLTRKQKRDAKNARHRKNTIRRIFVAGRKRKVRHDCNDEGCGQCEVCRYRDFIEWAEMVAPPGSVITFDERIERHLKSRGRSR